MSTATANGSPAMPCTSPPEAVGIVLAGGRSSRMGRDKAELEWRCGQTLLGRAIELVEAAGCGKVIVSGRRPGHDHVPDREPGLGPLGGLDSVLRQRGDELEGSLLLILPLDMPLLEAETLETLLQAGSASGTGARFANGPLPMVLHCTARLPRTIGDLLAGNGKHSLAELGRALDLAVHSPVAANQMENINRFDELARLRAAAGEVS